MKYRVGFGYDVHQLSDGIPFWLGGIKIEHIKGAVGHSDADVLIHAICDALLGAANERDIGFHFPDNDASLKGIDSKILLAKTIDIIAKKGFQIENVDTSVCLQNPKISKYIPEMQKVLASTMSISANDIAIKATTTEKLGFTGREEGIAAYATVLISKE